MIVVPHMKLQEKIERNCSPAPPRLRSAGTLYQIVERRERRRFPDNEKTSKIRGHLNDGHLLTSLI